MVDAYVQLSSWVVAAHPRQLFTLGRTGITEYTMFAYLARTFHRLLEHAEHNRRNVYLASSVDIFELERRMRSIEITGG
jgi:Protein of unknown function (DUF3563)